MEASLQVRSRTAEERRAEILAHVTALGIDENYISVLVEAFYMRIRQDAELGPIFGRHVEDWDLHLPRMKTFWGGVVFGDGRYSGKPVPAHVKLDDVQPEHFRHWLGLFEATLKETAPNAAVASFFMERAERIARSLKMAMFESVETLLRDAQPHAPKVQ